MKEINDHPPLSGNRMRVVVRPYSTALTEKEKDLDAVRAILGGSVKYYNLSLSHAGDVKNGLMIASITLFFSCFERANTRYCLKASIYRKDQSTAEQYEKFKHIRDEYIAHRARRRSNNVTMRPTDPAMLTVMPAVSAHDTSHVTFSITPDEINQFGNLLKFTTSVIDKQTYDLQHEILKESIDAGSTMPDFGRRRNKRKNKNSG